MKFFLAQIFVVAVLAIHMLNADDDEERRLKSGNSFQRRSKPCSFLCGVKDRVRRNNPSTCYLVPSQNNQTISECVYNCLKFKGEKLEDAVRCDCVNGVCTSITTGPTSAAPSSAGPTTGAPTTAAPTTGAPTTAAPAARLENSA